MALSLPPLQQKRMGSRMVIRNFSDKFSAASKTEPCEIYVVSLVPARLLRQLRRWPCPEENPLFKQTLDPVAGGGRSIARHRRAGSPQETRTASRKLTAVRCGLRSDISGRGGNPGQGRESRWRLDIACRRDY